MQDFKTQKLSHFEQRENFAKTAWYDFVEAKASISLNDKNQDFNLILESWKRCAELGIDPYQEIKSFYYDYDGCFDHVQMQLLEHLYSSLEYISYILKDSNTTINIYNKDLVLVKTFSCGKIKPNEKGKLFCMKEEIAGTNAIDITAKIKKPFVTIGHENYRTQFHNRIFEAVPLVGKNGLCFGAVSVESLFNGKSESLMEYLIPILSIFSDKTKDILHNKQSIYNAILDNIDQATVVTDSNGIVLYANNVAKPLFIHDNNSFVGVDIRKVWEEENPFAHVIENYKKIDSNIQITPSKKSTLKISGHITPIISETNQLLYIVGVFDGKDGYASGRKDKKATAAYRFDDIIGSSEQLLNTINVAKMVAKMNINVVVQGESGTGKELFAHAIHNESPNCDGPFVAVNCAAIPSSLLESELFGYESGAFTGAKKEGHAGKFETASGGTIFLDEISSMPYDMQAKILRTVQMKTITRVGGSKVIPINTRIIAATNVDLWELVKSGNFREDLYFRLNVMSIVVPPLRERKEDISLIVDVKKKEIIKRISWGAEISNGGMCLLKSYDYPGNVRELENILERCYVLAAAKNEYIITEKDLMSYRGIQEFFQLNNSIKTGCNEEKSDQEKAANKDLLQVGGTRIAEIERELINDAMETYDGNITAVAQELGIARTTLYRKMKKYNITFSKE